MYLRDFCRYELVKDMYASIRTEKLTSALDGSAVSGANGYLMYALSPL